VQGVIKRSVGLAVKLDLDQPRVELEVLLKEGFANWSHSRCLLGFLSGKHLELQEDEARFSWSFFDRSE
jgi:hypothetical protein